MNLAATLRSLRAHEGATGSRRLLLAAQNWPREPAAAFAKTGIGVNRNWHRLELKQALLKMQQKVKEDELNSLLEAKDPIRF